MFKVKHCYTKLKKAISFSGSSSIDELMLIIEQAKKQHEEDVRKLAKSRLLKDLKNLQSKHLKEHGFLSRALMFEILRTKRNLQTSSIYCLSSEKGFGLRLNDSTTSTWSKYQGE